MAHDEGPYRRQPFDHRQHLKFAWTVLSEVPSTDAAELVGAEIRGFAAVHAPGKYHETLTRFWVSLVAHTRTHDKNAADFDDHLSRFPILLDPAAPKRHYSAAVLQSDVARRSYIPPDVSPVPAER
jgi:hypothetical protein